MFVARTRPVRAIEGGRAIADAEPIVEIDGSEPLTSITGATDVQEVACPTSADRRRWRSRHGRIDVERQVAEPDGGEAELLGRRDGS